MNVRTVTVPVPLLAMIGGTRVAGGVGLGLLLADRLEHARRRAVGWTLLGVGAISTIPLIAEVVSRSRRAGSAPPFSRPDPGAAPGHAG
jgi:hypothetical protein